MARQKEIMMKRKSRLYTFLFMTFGILFLFSACKVYRMIAQAQREQQEFDCLIQLVQSPAGPAAYAHQPEAKETEGEEGEETLSSYALLKERNPDFFGWIFIEGTKLNYPVMATPEDEEYYLHRNFDGESSQSGVPFLAASCYEGCGNYLIYGHNMKNGTMFSSLLSYADQTYWEQHPVIRFDTLTDSGEYMVMAAFYSEAYPQDASGVFRFYQYADLSEPAVFAEYMGQVQRAALYDTGIRAEYGDQLLTLSTCSYHKKEGRFVVIARKKLT